MVFVLMALLFDAIFSRVLGSDMVQTGSINAPKYVFSRIFMQLECKKHVFSRDFGLQISPRSLLGLLRFTHAKHTYFLVFLGCYLAITPFDWEPFCSIFVSCWRSKSTWFFSVFLIAFLVGFVSIFDWFWGNFLSFFCFGEGFKYICENPRKHSYIRQNQGFGGSWKVEQTIKNASQI